MGVSENATKSFGFTMSFSIMVSLFVAFSLTPMLSARWLSPSKKGVKDEHAHGEEETESDSLDELPDPAPGPRKEEKELLRQWGRGTRVVPGHEGEHAHSHGPYAILERLYMKLLAFSMIHRWAVMLLVFASCASTVKFGKVVQKNFLPLEDESRFEITMRAPEGTSLDQTQILADRITREVRAIDGVGYTVTTVGSAAGDPSGRGPNEASIFIALKPIEKRKLDQQTLMVKVREEVLPKFAKENLRVLVSPVNVFGGGGADSAAIQYVIRGPDINKLATLSNTLLEKVKTVKGLVDVDTTLVVGKPEYVVRINRQRAGDLGVTVLDVANSLRLLVADIQVSSFNEKGEQYEVHLRGRDEFRSDIKRLEQITVPAGIGRSVKLSDVVEVVEETGPSVIRRLARQRQVTLYANTVPGTSEADVIAQIEAFKKQMKFDAGYEGELAGRSKELGKAGKSFAFAFILSLVFMYLVLAAQFESWIHPVTILISLPLTVPFALMSLVAFKQSMNIFSTLGILVLFGIVKKNSILQVDHMRDLRRRGLSRADAIMIGNRDRLRPILMTTIAFVAGMIPLVYSSGAGAGTNRSIGIVVMGGQSLSLLLTLLATPVVYSLFDDAAHSRFVYWIARILSFPFRMVDKIFTRSEPKPPPAAT